jgi:hypothetical protein
LATDKNGQKVVVKRFPGEKISKEKSVAMMRAYNF